MKTRKKMLMLLALLSPVVSLLLSAQEKPDTLWVQFDDRFTENDIIKLQTVDSIEFTKARMKQHVTLSSGISTSTYKAYRTDGVYRFDEVERSLVKPSGYANVDFTKETSQWCFQRSMESEHFVCFWEKGLTLRNNTITLGGSSVNVKTLLNNGEKIWKKYVEELGFLAPGQSLTDQHKICMFIVNQTDWRADGSGQDGTVWYYDGTSKKSKSYKVGLFHCNPWAAGAEGGHTAAHEIGHVFQYLVSADYAVVKNQSEWNYGWRWGFGNNGDGGCAWWESCAQWQAFNVFPATLFSNSYYGQYVSSAYKNLLHEDYRYANYFIQYYWCQLYGQDFIGRMWRTTKRPEDPVETYIRMNNITQDDFNKMMFDYACRAATWDIDGIRDRGKNYQNAFSTTLKYVEGTDNTYAVSADCCPQNYGFNIIPLKGIQSGATLKADFKGIAGATGYRKINVAKAGWRYGFVAQTTDGERVYGDMFSDKEGVATLTLPENTQRAWFVVTGAPTEHWRHPWNDSDADDEQWPYQVAFENCSAVGTTRTYGDYPEDYARRDTTVVIEADLPYDGSGYGGINIPYDMDAISQALGVSTAQMKALKRNTTAGTKGTLVFAGVSKNGNLQYNTTTSTSSSTCYGHWFTTAGNVVGYDTSAAIYAELYPDTYICKLGQYPAHLTKGKSYTIRQAIIYTHTDGKQYRATMEVHVNVK
ncbi:MAG: DUF4859 domain-containing protein [Bacteroidaceae bacterium]|nr:DUF4859 domain-containing protein [Bacteroidaceae bacterium]